MLKSSRKAFSSATSKFKKSDLIKEPLAKSEELINPEDRFHDEALENLHYRSLVTIALGKNFSERVDLTKSEVERFTLLYGTDQTTLKRSTYTGLIPLRRKGYSWESTQSSSLRRKYREHADKMFNRLELCNFEPDHFNSGSIELCNIPYKTVDYLEFSSAAALVDKKPHKRKNHNSGDSVYFKDFYLNGQRGMFFGVFDALSSKANIDHQLSSSLLSFFKKFFNSTVFTNNEAQIFELFTKFLNQAELFISSNYPAYAGVSASIGLVYNGYLYYLNMGDCRIYSFSFYPEIKVNKLTVDDGMAGLIERGASLTRRNFFSQLKSPEYYLGGFSQSIKGKRGQKIIRGKIKPLPPNIGKISLKSRDFLLIATDGFWSNLPMLLKGNNIFDASGERAIHSILSNQNLRDPKQIIESLYSYSKLNMKLRKVTVGGDSIIKPSPQDIALLGFSL